MSIFIACRDWLGIGAALRLRQARPTLNIALALPDTAGVPALSARSAAWLAARDPGIAALLKTALRGVDALAVARGPQRIEIHGQQLSILDQLPWTALQAELIGRNNLTIRPKLAGDLMVGMAARRRFVECRAMAECALPTMLTQFHAAANGARCQLRVFPLGERRALLQLLAPAQAGPLNQDDIAQLLQWAGIEDRAALFALLADHGARLARDLPAVDYDLGGEADLLALDGADNAIAAIEALADSAARFDNGAAIGAAAGPARAAIAAAGQHAARNLLEWHSNPGRYGHLPISQFAYSLVSASQRIGHEQMRTADPALVQSVEADIAKQAGLDQSTPPMFTPFRLRGLTLANRIVVSPMCMYSARDGAPDDFHLVHLGARAMGGAGLVLSEMTDVSAQGRISPGCAGLYEDAHIGPWKRIVDFVHGRSPARIGVQLGHAGPKASTQLGWQHMDEPLAEGNWPIIAASALAYGPRNQVPKAMDEADMALVERQFADAAQRAIACGFDIIELHFAHGYLLSSFISPLTNLRSDTYGGSLGNRLRFPLRVFGAVRRVWPEDRPISVRLSASDWAAGGVDADQAVDSARAFKAAGADAITVSTGQTTRLAKPLYGRMYQVPFADRIRQEAGVPTIAVGAITEADQVNSIIAAGRADLCALARPHLADAAWTLRAGIEQGQAQLRWPKQYLAGKAQAERESGRPALRGVA